MTIMFTTNSLKAARAFRRMCADPKSLKIMQHVRTFTVPGKGITTSVEYTVEVR